MNYMKKVEESGLSIGAIAKKAGLARMGVYKTVHNISDSRCSTLAKMCVILNITPEEVLREEIEKFRKEIEVKPCQIIKNTTI